MPTLGSMEKRYKNSSTKKEASIILKILPHSVSRSLLNCRQFSNDSKPISNNSLRNSTMKSALTISDCSLKKSRSIILNRAIKFQMNQCAKSKILKTITSIPFNQSKLPKLSLLSTNVHLMSAINTIKIQNGPKSGIQQL